MLKTIDNLCAKLGGERVSEFSPRVTHLVTVANNEQGGNGPRLCRRTLKYLQCVVGLCWIVGYEWVIESVVNKQWIAEAQFEIDGDTQQPEDTSVSHSLFWRQSFSRRLFENTHFYLFGDFSVPTKKEIRSLVEAGGGQLVASEAQLFSRELLRIPLQPGCRLVVLSDVEATSVGAAQQFFDRTARCPVSLRWLFDTISSFSFALPPTDYFLVAPPAHLHDQFSLAF
ncbi:MAG: hypothetical protein K2Q09_11825 [Phycisphaerales bacterium]|nr:hypothetical protein [Phycisphaerales bacterium]